MQGYIYKITNLVNGKIYIGKTTKTSDKRFKEHLQESRGRQKAKDQGRPVEGRSIIHDAISKYGEENFVVETIHEVQDHENIDELEKFYIKQYNSQNDLVGYNICSGGQGSNVFGSETPELYKEHCKKISDAHKGMKRSLESRIRQSESLKGHSCSEETREKLRIASGSRTHSEETKQKISNSKRGKAPWNKGLTLDDARVKKNRDSRMKTLYEQKQK